MLGGFGQVELGWNWVEVEMVGVSEVEWGGIGCGANWSWVG